MNYPLGYNRPMIRDQQIDKISEFFIDVSKGLTLAAFAIRLFTTSDIIIFWIYIITAFTCAIFAIKVLELKKRR